MNDSRSSFPRAARPVALAIVAHGTRSAQGLAQSRAFARALAERLALPAQLCFLELAEPDLDTGLALSAEAVHGAGDVTVLPLFLGAGDHYKSDTPDAMRRCAERYPGVTFRYAVPLGPHPRLIDLLRLRVEQALATHPDRASPEETALLVVGRGSLEEDSNSEIARLACLLRSGAPWRAVEYAFQAVKHPTVAEGVARCRQLGARQVVVAPYLLFAGRVYDDICATSARAAEPDMAVIHAEYLAGSSDSVHGDAPRAWLVDVAEQRAREAHPWA